MPGPINCDASHELRTPITVIRPTAEVILERERSNAEFKEMVGLILRESESTSTLIEQLSTLARTDVGTEQLKLEELDLRSVIEELDVGSRTLAEHAAYIANGKPGAARSRPWRSVMSPAPAPRADRERLSLHGKGWSPPLLPRFERTFFDAEGTGLGLPIAQ